MAIKTKHQFAFEWNQHRYSIACGEPDELKIPITYWSTL
jgi:hypothetical protein